MTNIDRLTWTLDPTLKQDKAIVEAMATETPVLTSNDAAAEILGPLKDPCLFPSRDDHALAERIEKILRMSEQQRRELGQGLRAIVVHNHTVGKLVDRIIQVVSEAAS